MRSRALARALVTLVPIWSSACVLVQRVIEPPCPSFDVDRVDVPPGARVLVFSKTHGYEHDSIPAALTAVERAAARVGLSTFSTRSGAAFTAENLARVDVVVFVSANGTVLSPTQEAAFRVWVERGGAVVLLHGAVGDFDRASPWWWTLIGARFVGHTLLPNVVQATVRATPHPVTARLPATFEVDDEIYAFIDVRVRRDQILLRTHTGPLSWLHEVGAGRVWVYALGHTREQWSTAETETMLEDGLSFVTRPR